jgi:hypothetical protein
LEDGTHQLKVFFRDKACAKAHHLIRGNECLRTNRVTKALVKSDNALAQGQIRHKTSAKKLSRLRLFYAATRFFADTIAA